MQLSEGMALERGSARPSSRCLRERPLRAGPPATSAPGVFPVRLTEAGRQRPELQRFWGGAASADCNACRRPVYWKMQMRRENASILTSPPRGSLDLQREWSPRRARKRRLLPRSCLRWLRGRGEGGDAPWGPHGLLLRIISKGMNGLVFSK